MFQIAYFTLLLEAVKSLCLKIKQNRSDTNGNFCPEPLKSGKFLIHWTLGETGRKLVTGQLSELGAPYTCSYITYVIVFMLKIACFESTKFYREPADLYAFVKWILR